MEGSSGVSAGAAVVVVVVVACPGFCLKFTRTPPGLITGLVPAAASRGRGVGLAALVTASCTVAVAASLPDSWLSSVAFGELVVGLPRRLLMFSLLNDGLDIPDGPLAAEVDPPLVGADVVVETADLVPVGPRNLPRVPEEGFSACTVLELSFCTASSSTGCFWPGRALLKPPPLEPLPPKRLLVRCVGSADASVVVVLPPPFDLNLMGNNRSINLLIPFLPTHSNLTCFEKWRVLLVLVYETSLCQLAAEW